MQQQPQLAAFGRTIAISPSFVQSPIARQLAFVRQRRIQLRKYKVAALDRDAGSLICCL
jgi:hypothetical protein